MELSAPKTAMCPAAISDARNAGHALSASIWNDGAASGPYKAKRIVLMNENADDQMQDTSCREDHTEPPAVPPVDQESGSRDTAAKEALAAIVDDLCNDVPENMRGLIPNLPPVEKVKWLREARAKGLFRPQAPTSSPDSKRPVAKPAEDLNNLSPVAMMARGYK